MNKDLHKRLGEAAYKYAKRVVPECIPSYVDFFNSTRADFRNGAKFGYKEAIEVAKEWLLERGKIDTLDAVELDMQMNKLWEEKK